MTLVVAVRTDSGVWLGGERIAGDFDWTEMAGPKIFELDGPGYHFGIGFAGSPRVAQAVLAVDPPDGRDHSLHWWLTEYCDAIYRRLSDFGLLADPRNGDEAHLAGHSGFVLATDGRVFLVDKTLSWEESTRGYVANGGAHETFNGAYEVLADLHHPVEAARRAWPYVQRRHRIGDLTDEITIMAGA